MRVWRARILFTASLVAAGSVAGVANAGHLGENLTLPGVATMQSVDLPAGTFQMGSPSSESGRSSDEMQHPVTLTRTFRMQTTEVTQGQWRALMGNNPSTFADDDNRPVETLSWFDAVAYANALSAKDGLPKAYDLSFCTGKPGTGSYNCSRVTLTSPAPDSTTGWRLPTEAEWEYAYRAGTATAWVFGADSNLLGTHAWFGGNSDGTTHPVGLTQCNPWGLYDMAGNVWEWCQDWYGSYPGSLAEPLGPTRYRVIRGGSWLHDAASTRAANRNFNVPSLRYGNLGFRLVRSMP
ncbi:MAG: formylglycine-generating enzyme family protein [Candidatus Sericytochromatia bacterium]|nr:formylglycine-generating enzyme family protein [Candidatus Sericytochromatia bacterium]